MQAVQADSVTIGKTLDTTDDMARLTVIHSRAGTKKGQGVCLVSQRPDVGDSHGFGDFVIRTGQRWQQNQGQVQP